MIGYVFSGTWDVSCCCSRRVFTVVSQAPLMAIPIVNPPSMVALWFAVPMRSTAIPCLLRRKVGMLPENTMKAMAIVFMEFPGSKQLSFTSPSWRFLLETVNWDCNWTLVCSGDHIGGHLALAAPIRTLWSMAASDHPVLRKDMVIRSKSGKILLALWSYDYY